MLTARCSKNNYIIISLIIISSIIVSCQSQIESSTGIFDRVTDVGNPELKGETIYNNETGEYTLTGAGENMWFDNDEFHFLSREIEGDFILQSRVRFIGKGVNEHRKFGIMVRNSLSGGSAHINAVVHGDGLTSLQYRSEEGNNTEEVRSTDMGPDIIILERKGDNFIFSSAAEGTEFTTIEVPGLKLGSLVHVGIFICSHEIDVLETAVFDNVKLIIQ